MNESLSQLPRCENPSILAALCLAADFDVLVIHVCVCYTRVVCAMYCILLFVVEVTSEEVCVPKQESVKSRVYVQKEHQFCFLLALCKVSKVVDM